MRKYFVLLCFLISSLSLAHGQKTRFSQVQKKPDPATFPLHVHISSSKIRLSCGGAAHDVVCSSDLFAEALIDGKKVELWGDAKVGKYKPAVIAPGDYLAQVTDEVHNDDSSVISRNYLLLFSDGTTWRGALSGISE